MASTLPPTATVTPQPTRMPTLTATPTLVPTKPHPPLPTVVTPLGTPQSSENVCELSDARRHLNRRFALIERIALIEPG